MVIKKDQDEVCARYEQLLRCDASTADQPGTRRFANNFDTLAWAQRKVCLGQLLRRPS